MNIHESYTSNNKLMQRFLQKKTINNLRDISKNFNEITSVFFKYVKLNK